nr:immunoglobulin heavy chain junction region [Macaca mulatta]
CVAHDYGSNFGPLASW